MKLLRSIWFPVIALLGITTAVIGLAPPSRTPIKIWDAAFYDSEDCKAGSAIEVACPLYTMRIQGKGFTSHIQNACDSQISDTGVRKCTIPVDMNFFHDRWGLHDPSVHHRKSMWIDYECSPGIAASKPIRIFGAEATDGRARHITMACD